MSMWKKTERHYMYFVSYAYVGPGSDYGFGESVVSITYRLDSGDSIVRLTEFLKEANNYKSLSIMNFIRMKG